MFIGFIQEKRRETLNLYQSIKQCITTEIYFLNSAAPAAYSPLAVMPALP